MSMLWCDVCDDVLIDTDHDPHAFQACPDCVPYTRSLEMWVCEQCREKAYDREMERQMEEAA